MYDSENLTSATAVWIMTNSSVNNPQPVLFISHKTIIAQENLVLCEINRAPFHIQILRILRLCHNYVVLFLSVNGISRAFVRHCGDVEHDPL